MRFAVGGLAPLPFSGDFTQEVTLVPIPNTTVKLLGPMIVPTSAKVGYCRNPSKDLRFAPLARDGVRRFLLRAVRGQVFQLASPVEIWGRSHASPLVPPSVRQIVRRN